jgi:hypothetical protein
MVAGREDVRTLARPVVALSASTVPPSGRPSNRSSGHPVSRCPDGQASGVRGAAALSGPRWALEWLGVVGRPSVGRSGSTCRRGPRAAWSPAGIGPNGKRWCDVGRPWLARGSTVAQVRRLAGFPAAAPLGHLTMGLDREVVTTLSGRWAGGGPVSSSSGGPLGSVGSSLRPQRGRGG